MPPEPPGSFNQHGQTPRITSVRTDVPAFIGHTAQAHSGQTSLTRRPTNISSLREYEQYFGGPPADAAPYLLYDSVTLFFENGGRDCVIASVGSYDEPITRQTLTSALTPLAAHAGVALVVVPETVRLSRQDALDVQRAVLTHCGETTQNRFAVLDVPAGDQPPQSASPVTAFAEALPPANRSYGAAYYPWLLFAAPRLGGRTIVIPASAVVAGVYAAMDNARGVWKAPANVALSGIAGPAVQLTHADLDALLSVTTGIAVNAIRAFPGRGTLVWGARTLDGTSNDWRYVNVRRTVLMMQESIGIVLNAFAVEPNTAQTWVAIRAVVEDYLVNVWRAGALLGATPKEAFSARVGLGETMTAQDIADGRLILELMLAFVRPAEFIVIRLAQNMAA